MARLQRKCSLFELGDHDSTLDETERSTAGRGPGIFGVLSRQILERLAHLDTIPQTDEMFSRLIHGIGIGIGRNRYQDVGDLALLWSDEAFRFGVEQSAELLVVRPDTGGNLIHRDFQIAQAQSLGCRVLAAMFLEVGHDLRFRGFGDVEIGGRNGKQREGALLQSNPYGVTQCAR